MIIHTSFQRIVYSVSYAGVPISSLPNIMYSRALAYYRLHDGEVRENVKALSCLRLAILAYPSLLKALIESTMNMKACE